jgi:hypothetical protein
MRLLAVSLIVLGIATAARAQDSAVAPARDTVFNVAAEETSPPDANASAPLSTSASAATPLLSVGVPRASLAALSFAGSPFDVGSASPSAFSPVVATSSSASPSVPPKPQYGYNERDYNIDIAFAIDVVRFRSPAFYATAVGPHVSAAFFFKDWLAVEGAITSAFAPAIFSDTVRYLSYSGGLKMPFSLGRKKFEPWAHILAGGLHVGPQTSLGSKNGFEFTAGGGVDYALSPRWSLRIEADYLGSHLYSQWLHSGQGLAGVVFHF